ncbi:MAG: PEP-CTERM sorting domain-containing protein [Kiritimatiellae bacterium]|nr:PEP-CTERM sorting domain-containing protein [Kiritimatiellia bacterium]
MKNQMRMQKMNRSTPLWRVTCAMAVMSAMAAPVAASFTEVLWTDGSSSNSHAATSSNWENGILPNPTNGYTGVVPDGFQVTKNWDGGLRDLRISFMGSSSFEGSVASGNMWVDQGNIALIFNDSSAFNALKRVNLGAPFAGDATLTFNDNSTGTAGGDGHLRFRAGGPGSLALNHDATFTYLDSIHLEYDATEGIQDHRITLSDRAKLIGEGSGGLWRSGSAEITFDFRPADPNNTPGWTLPTNSFNQSWINWEINGVSTTLADERFSIIQNIDSTYTLTAIPEPSSLMLMALAGLSLLGLRYRKHSKN